MDKILLVFGALALAVGALLLPRRASGATQCTDDDPLCNIDVELGEGSSGPFLDSGDSFVTPSTSPFGIRNNNPFNLRFRDIGWRGEIGNNNGFSVFDTAENGIRAGMINIHTKMTRDGANTVRKLISILSPPNENPTDIFIQTVANRMSVSPDQTLSFPVHITRLSQEIIRFENGQQPYSFEQLENALRETGRV